MSVINNLLDLSKLFTLLEKALKTTTITNRLVSESSDDVRRVLTNWQFSDVGYGETPTCICFESQLSVKDDVSVDEIAKGIDDVIGNAQKVREELCLDRHRIKLRHLDPNDSSPFDNVKCNLVSHYTSGNSNVGLMEPCKPRLSPSSWPRYFPVTGGCNNSVDNNSRPLLNYIESKSCMSGDSPFTPHNENKVTKLSDRVGSISSSSNQSSKSMKSTYQNDFGCKRSRSIASKHASRPQLQLRKTKSVTARLRNVSSTNTKEKNVTKPITMAQLNNLLSHVSINGKPAIHQDNPVINMGVSESSNRASLKQLNENCLIHGKAAPLKCVSTTFASFADAIDRLGVPSELVKVLKSYHRYATKVQHQDYDVKKDNKAASQFLSQMNHKNEKHWNEAMQEPTVSLFAEYSKLFVKTSKVVECSQNELEHFLAEFMNLEKRYRKCTGHDATFLSGNLAISCNHGCQDDSKSYQEWALAGIWNEDTVQGLKGIEDTLRIRYNNEAELQKFQENIQYSQSLQYQNQLLDLLLANILPQFANLDPLDISFAKLFKTVFALCNVRKLTLPSLVKVAEN